jgi:hypothetical protein
LVPVSPMLGFASAEQPGDLTAFGPNPNDIVRLTAVEVVRPDAGDEGGPLAPWASGCGLLSAE